MVLPSVISKKSAPNFLIRIFTTLTLLFVTASKTNLVKFAFKAWSWVARIDLSKSALFNNFSANSKLPLRIKSSKIFDDWMCLVNKLTISVFPLCSAISRAVCPWLFCCKMSTPFSNNNLTTSVWPASDEKWRELLPLFSLLSIWAPFSNNNLTTLTWPLIAAKWRAVSPSLSCCEMLALFCNNNSTL